MTRSIRLGLRQPYLIGLGVLIVWPLIFSSSYELRVFTLAGIYALLVLGYQFVFGHAGLLALTQGTFFGVGAYTTGVLGAKLGWPFQATMLLSVLGPLLLAAIVAAPVLRLQSHYFALATLGIAQVAWLVAVKWESVTGGANGLAGVPGVAIFNAAVPRGLPLALLVWGIVAIGVLITWQVTRGLYGRAFHVLRTSETAAAALGIDTARLRFAAFLLSAGFAGVAGALYAHTLRVISPEVLEFHVMVTCLAMTVVGGQTRIAGAILGSFLLVHLPEWFRALEGYYLIAYGAVLLVTIVAAPDGLTGLFARLRARIFPEPPPQAPKPVALRALPGRDAKKPDTVGALLEVEHVTKRFGGVDALKGVSLHVRRGEIFGVIGPNGSGKTTLINIVTGLYRPEAGNVRLACSDITGDPPFKIAQHGIARTFQNLDLVGNMSALDNVAVARGAVAGLGLRRALATTRDDVDLLRARGEAMALLDMLDVGRFAMRLCADLPPGVKRRVEIARALALEPRLLLLDEPAAGLSEAEQARLSLDLRSLAAGGLTLLIVEHNMRFLMPLASRVLCLDSGNVIAEGTAAEVQADPKVIGAYLGTALVARA